jgi:hypothetical protein
LSSSSFSAAAAAADALVPSTTAAHQPKQAVKYSSASVFAGDDVAAATARENLAEDLRSIHKEITGETLSFRASESKFGIGLMMKDGPMGYPHIVGVRQGSAADNGGVR